MPAHPGLVPMANGYVAGCRKLKTTSYAEVKTKRRLGKTPAADFDNPAQISRPAPQMLMRKTACACGGSCPQCEEESLQRKAVVSQPGDACEREADRIADQVMRTNISSVANVAEQKSAPVTRSAEKNGSMPAEASDVLQGGGQPLDRGTRSFFEPRFGRDLGDVRVHINARANASAHSLGAHAYTYGHDIVFGPGQYNPHQSTGRHLLAHELVHVMQQEQSPSVKPMVMRQAYTGCDVATTGVDDSDKKVGAAHERAVNLAISAMAELSSPDNATLAMADRHFHCPSSGEIKTVSDNFRKINSKLLSVSPSCVDAADESCQGGRDSRLDAISGPLSYLRFCPGVFALDDPETALIRAFIDAGARLSGLSLNCLITAPCYGDASVGAESMVDNIDSYVAFAIELSGHTFAPVSTVACGGDRDERWRRIRRELAGPTAEDRQCTYNACGDRSEDVRDDLKRAIEGADKVIGALSGEPDKATARALDWYFNDSSEPTIDTVRERLVCIKGALQDTLDNDRFGCTRRRGAYAFVMSNGPLCDDTFARVCLDRSYFGMSGRSRIATLIHECGHRIGLSVSESGMDDVYGQSARFLNLRTSSSLLNTDSYAHFVNAILNGVPLTLLYEPFGGAYGKTSEGGNVFRITTGLEAQHPSLLFFNPTLGLAFTSIIQPTGDVGSIKPGADMFVSLLGGVRIADPRPGEHGGAYLDVRGGPTLAFTIGEGAGLGGEAAATVGWRWRWLDVGVSGGVIHDPLRDEGERTVYYGGVKISILPLLYYVPKIE